ncbi:MAG: glycosyltransferase [Candidatus Pacearchaeota archaeon]
MDKIKVLFVTDDIRMPTGVGIQALKIMQGLMKSGRYTVSSIAGSLRKQNNTPLVFKDIKLYPTSDAYGNPNLLRTVMNIEKPDIIVLFSDPRFFSYVFSMDNEIRLKSKVVLYHTWDNTPFPKFNIPYYSACDYITTISKFSHDLLQSNNINNVNIHHGQDSTEFFSMDSNEVKKIRSEFVKRIGKPNTDFIIFWNNRNISRKRPGDVILSFLEFYKTHPNSILLMNTVAVDPEGTDIPTVVKDLNTINAPIILNQQRVDTNQLNMFYNISDVTLNIAHSEGFGLCVSESLFAGTPCIVTSTGGMTEQMQTTVHHDVVKCDDGKGCSAFDENVEFGILLKPEVKDLFGVPQAPYIHRDYVSVKTIVNALSEAYMRVKDGTWKTTVGNLGQKFMVENYSIENTLEKWDKYLQDIYSSPKTFKSWRFSVH